MTALRCSFCNRTVNEVGRIISGPNPACIVHICNECVEVCVGILHDGTGEVDVSKRFKQRRPRDSGSLSFIIPVLILLGVGYCVWGYHEGGVPELEEKFLVWLTASVVALLLGHWLRRPRQVNK